MPLDPTHWSFKGDTVMLKSNVTLILVLGILVWILETNVLFTVRVLIKNVVFAPVFTLIISAASEEIVCLDRRKYYVCCCIKTHCVI